MRMRRDDPGNPTAPEREESARDGSQRASSQRDGDVRELIRAAGRRPAPPADDLAAITAAARSAWRERVGESGDGVSSDRASGDRASGEWASGERASGEREVGEWTPGRAFPLRSLALAASLALAVLAGWWWLRTADRPVVGGTVASVEILHGAATADGSPLSSGSELRSGADISTVGDPEASRLSVRMTAGQSLRIDAGTLVHLSSSESVELRHGRIYVDSPPGSGLRALDVVTPLGTVMEIGTQFEVSYDNRAGELEVRVREGAVSVRNDGQAATARRGESLAVRRDGSVSRSEVPADGETWEWILEIAPAMEIEGRSLRDFLDWVERETGREVDYAGEDLAADAETIVLSGTLDGLRPDQAIDVILRGAGLEATDDGDRLVVSRSR